MSPSSSTALAIQADSERVGVDQPGSVDQITADVLQLYADVLAAFREFYNAHLARRAGKPLRRKAVSQLRQHIPGLHEALDRAVSRAGSGIRAELVQIGAGSLLTGVAECPDPWLAELFSAIGQALRSGDQVPALVYTQSSEVYQSVRRFVEGRKSLTPTVSDQGGGSAYPWPVTSIGGRSVRGFIEVNSIKAAPEILTHQPAESQREAWNIVDGLSDHTADVLDCLSILWLERSRTNDFGYVNVTADDILTQRGLIPRPNGNGRRGGFSRRQRLGVMEEIHRIDSLWIQIQLEGEPGVIESRAFMIAGKASLSKDDPSTRFSIVPGSVFAHFLRRDYRQVALISTAALRYDPYRQSTEKRIARYLSWIWRVEMKRMTDAYQGKSLCLSKLMEAADLNPISRRDRARMKTALDTLAMDCVIESWKLVDDGRQRDYPLIFFRPPQVLVDTYRPERAGPRSIAGSGPAIAPVPLRISAHAGDAVEAEHPLRSTILERRRQLNLTQAKASQMAGMSQAEWSRAESGDISPGTEAKLRHWLARESVSWAVLSQE